MNTNMKLYSLQAMRGIAALLVVADHALLEISHNEPGNPITNIAWTLGNAGVYIFFVISGFIMVHICWESFGRKAAAANFLRRRFIRIVPLYWLATLAALAYHKVSSTHGGDAGWSELIYSLAFIPYSNDQGSWNPILPQGWTLSYEMVFYAIFALGLFFSRGFALIAVAVTLTAFVIFGPLVPNETVRYLASPIVLWFLLGMALATLWHWRGFGEPQWLARAAKFLEPVGDASYSTYLVHGLILTVLLRAWMVTVGLPSIWLVLISIAVAAIAGWITFVIVEKRILGIFTNFRKRTREATTSLKVSGTSYG
jgi:exopolysaccharide production protein ExoZ